MNQRWIELPLLQHGHRRKRRDNRRLRFRMRNMNQLQRALIYGAAAIFFLTAPIGAQDQSNIAARKNYAQVAAALESLIHREMQDKQLPAFSIALVDGNEIVWAQGFGYQDPEHKIPATAHTIYRVGSVSKLFTDIGIMQMVEAGTINLDAPVSRYIPDFHPRNPFQEPITLRELMSHRSGLLREPPVGNYFDPDGPTLEATVRSMNSTDLVYPPGTQVKYSNAGIAVVGYTLQQLNHKLFPEYLKQAVLAPFGMKESAFAPETQLIRNLAKADMWSYDGLTFPAPTFELGLAPAGCMYSTVTDLGQFLSVLFDGGRGAKGQVIKPETLAQMWTPQFAKPGEKTGFGIGFHISQLDSHRVIGHGGAIYGFATEVAGLPDDKLGVVTVTTADAANAVTNTIAAEALRMMMALRAGKTLPHFDTTAAVPVELVRKLAGRYGEGDDAVDLMEQGGDLEILPVKGGFQAQLRMLENVLVVD